MYEVVSVPLEGLLGQTDCTKLFQNGNDFNYQCSCIRHAFQQGSEINFLSSTEARGIKMENSKVKTKVNVRDKSGAAADELSRNTMHTAGFFGMGFGLWGLICFLIGLLAGGMFLGYFKAVLGIW